VKCALGWSDPGCEQASQSCKYDPVNHGDEHKPKALRGMWIAFCSVKQNHSRCSKHRVSEEDGDDTAKNVHNRFTPRMTIPGISPLSANLLSLF
jgi:hypothetical protein